MNAPIDTSIEPLYLLISDAHRAVMRPHDPLDPVSTIDAIIARLNRAKTAHLAGDIAAASHEFDPRYKVPA